MEPSEGMRRIDTDPEILAAAIVDGINAYIRELIREGILPTDFDDARPDVLLRLKYEVAERFAAQWKTTWIRDNA